MRAVVTGGAGFIGSTLVDRFLADGHDVVVLDDLSTGNEANLAGARATAGDRMWFELVDLREGRTADVIAEAGADVVFHLAAQADVRASVDDPIADAQANVLGTISVLEGARRAGSRKVVLASSGGTLYGDADPSLLPLDETTPHRPESPYGASKLAAGAYLRVYGSLYGVAWTELAMANVYGPRQDADGEAGVVAIFARRLLAGEPCTVYGSGEQTRDFVYVDDVVEAFVAAAERGDGQLFNIGTGVETSIDRLYRSMTALVDGPGEPLREAARTGELERSALDHSLAAAELDWRAVIDLDEGIRRTIDWFRSGN